MTIKAGEKPYCQVCSDDFSDENFCLGVCCGEEMKSRPYSEEEVAARCAATKAVIERAAYISW